MISGVNKAYDGYSKQSLTSVASKPSERESCKICKKFVYFHQPILLCTSCCKVFHGICLKISNDDVFVFQQILWYCPDCRSRDNYQGIFCESCFAEIDINREKLNICQLCRKPVHAFCLTDNLCISCSPASDSSLKSFTQELEIAECDKFFDNQPIFSPFEYYEKNIVDFIPEADYLNDSIQQCSLLLNTCKYLKMDDLIGTNQHNCFPSFIGLNVDGIRTNFDKLKIFNSTLLNYGENVAGYFLCETNVTEHESKPFYLEGFNKFTLGRFQRDNKSLKHKGSGLMIFLNQKFSRVQLCNNLNNSTLDFESLAIEVVDGSTKYLFISVYRSPSGDFDNFINLFDNILCNANERKEFKVFLFGDLNVNLYNSSSHRCMKYLSCVFSNGFLPLISRATHFAGHNPTCIDHILSNDVSEVISSSILREKISHHFPICIKLNTTFEGNSKGLHKPRLIINEFSLNSFIGDLEEIEKSLDFDDSAETCFSEFHDKFKISYDKCFLSCNNRRSSKKFVNLRKDWITIGIAKSCETRKQLYEKWLACRTPSNWNEYLRYSRKLDVIKDKVKFDYFKSKLDENKHDLKKTWGLINRILGRKRQNRLLTFPEEDAAHNFNKYFVSVANDLLENNYSNQTPNDSFMAYMKESVNTDKNGINLLETCTFDPGEISRIISSLNNSKSTYFSPRVLKSVVSKLSPILAKLFNKCVLSGYFPNELKTAKIIPLFKNKGSISDLSNYRPISLLSVFSKIFEKLIHREISDFLESNDILNESQYGFRKKRSTLHALLNSTENIYNACDSRLHTLGIFIDFSKAFDTVNHTILLKKLCHYGIRGDLLKLITCYLKGRKQYVSYGGVESTPLDIVNGVPQGSVLGPLLFIIFINDIVNISDIAKFVLFADDLNIFIFHSSREKLYKIGNQILQELAKYCCYNRLIMNYDKCCYMEFGAVSKNVQCTDYILGVMNNKFSKVYSCKFLGVLLNSTLNWNEHINHVIMQVSKSCGTMYRARLQVPRKILKQIYSALIQPYLNYCISLWGSSISSSSMNSLFILQKKCIRIIAGKTAKECGILRHTKPFFKNLKILTVFNLYVYFTASELMKILNTNTPKLLKEYFTISTHSGRFIYPKFNLEYYKTRSFVFNGSKILNHLLQQDIPYTGITNFTFKSRLKRHLLTIQSQSIAGDDGWLPCNHNIFSHIRL